MAEEYKNGDQPGKRMTIYRASAIVIKNLFRICVVEYTALCHSRCELLSF